MPILIFILVIGLCLYFLTVHLNNTRRGFIIRLGSSFFLPPLGVFLTLRSINRNPIVSPNFLVNLALTFSPTFGVGCVHAVSFLMQQEFSQRPNVQEPMRVYYIVFNNSSSNNRIQNFHTIVTIVAVIITTYIALQNFFHHIK